MASSTVIAIVLGLLIVIALPHLQEAMRKPMNNAARKDADGSFATLSQGVTYYEWHGPKRGPVAVCVHGLTTPSFVWRGLAKGMVLLGYRVLTYDLYGRGYSDRVPGPQDRAFFLQQLTDLLEDQKVGQDITVCGYSMGGAIATVFAATHPERVRHLVLLAPAGMGVNMGPVTRFVAQTPVIGDWLMLASFPRRHRKATDAERRLPSSVENIVGLQQRELRYKGFVASVLASMRGILSETLQAEHKAIHNAGVPVLAIWGRKDTVIPLSAMGQLAEWSRDAKQEVIDTAGHGLTYTDTDVVLDKMRETLRDGLT